MKQVISTTFLAALVIGLLSCGEQPVKTSEPVVASQSKHKLQLPLSDQQKQVIEKARYLRDVFPVEGVIRLFDDTYPVAEASWVTVIGENLFILDELQRQVLLFDMDGHFKKLVGRRGRGPGEYQSPSYLAPIWDDQLAVVDVMGRLLVFDKQGEHRFTLSHRKGHIIPTARFAWPEPDRLYATQYYGKQSQYLVQIMDYSNLDKGIPGQAFEPRYPYHLEFPEKLVYESFCLVGEVVWGSNPFETKINRYSAEGKLINSFELGLGEPKTYEDVVEKRRKHGEKILNQLGPDVLFIDSAGGVVVLTTSVGFLIYDSDGNRLSKTLPPETKILGTVEDRIITPLSDVFDLPVETRRGIFATSMADVYPLMKELGYEIENEDDTIYLRVGRLVH